MGASGIRSAAMLATCLAACAVTAGCNAGDDDAAAATPQEVLTCVGEAGLPVEERQISSDDGPTPVSTLEVEVERGNAISVAIFDDEAAAADYLDAQEDFNQDTLGGVQTIEIVGELAVVTMNQPGAEAELAMVEECI